MKEEDAELLRQQSKRKDNKPEPKVEIVETELTEAAATRRKLDNSFEYHFTIAYRQLSHKLAINTVLELEYKLLETIGNFRMNAIENTKLLINEMLFSKKAQAFKEVP